MCALVTAKQKIDSVFFLHEAELKLKKREEREKMYLFLGTAKVSELGDMFMDMNPEVVFSSSSTNSGDEDFIIHYKKKTI